MEQIDLTKLEKAIIYVDRIADGKNPVNNLPAEDEILNDPNVIRCMYFIRDVLMAVKNNDGVVGKLNNSNSSKDKATKKRQSFPLETLKDFSYVEPKTISRFVEQLNQKVSKNEYRGISHNRITAWLKKNGYLYDAPNEKTGKTSTAVTDKGRLLGITQKLIVDEISGYSYIRIEYERTAQEFIVSKIPEMMD